MQDQEPPLRRDQQPQVFHTAPISGDGGELTIQTRRGVGLIMAKVNTYIRHPTAAAIQDRTSQEEGTGFFQSITVKLHSTAQVSMPWWNVAALVQMISYGCVLDIG